MNNKLETCTEEILSTLQNAYIDCTDQAYESKILSAIVSVKQMQLNLFIMLQQSVEEYDPLDYCSPI